MQEFYQWLIFQSFIILICIVLYMFAAGMINIKRTRTESFKEWQKMNGGVIRWMCILLIIVSIGIIYYKYNQVTTTLTEPPTLQSE
ncbi:MAG: hypothetical protein KBF42_03095 [Chitinophagales bacterium]|jgi:cbb3-type cytochrome oxidase subunit 3|nr:hypothetical protein [Bacteroidota bacterium]MBK7568846.1 hypothetical protein [Bacteroidota bacterium]MBP8915421.1 hypothetical protein [Chitinophagales bacterium]MBP9220344.1 hypothetical protein [Chitinophagales bacterium]